MVVENDILDFLIKCVLAALSAFFTVKFSLSNFYTQKWWERKAGSYTDIIDCLAQIKTFYSEMSDDFIGGKKIPEEKVLELRMDEAKADKVLRNKINSATFLINDEAKDRLGKFIQEFDNADDGVDYYIYLDARWDISNKCIEDIIEIAKNDLKVKK